MFKVCSEADEFNLKNRFYAPPRIIRDFHEMKHINSWKCT